MTSCAPFTAALAQGEALGPIIEAIKARELERGRLRDERAHLDATPVQPIDPLTLRRVLRTRLVSWIAGLRRPPSEARHALRPLLQERLVFTPREDETGRYYEIIGVGTITPVLAGIVDTKAGCPRRATSPAHFWLACTSSSERTRLFGFDLAADG